MDNISKSKLTAFDVILPPNDIARAFSSHTTVLFDRIQLLQRQSVTLRTTRDLLLPKLISGEIDVSELEIQVPEAESAA